MPWRTVRRNVELLGELHDVAAGGLTRKGRPTRSTSSGLQGHEGKYPKQLSGGMKMRCSLARSLVMNPKVFLFDEPFGALDEITRERLNDELLSLFQSEGFAGLFITHSIAEAVFLSTRVLVMSARPGRIIDDIADPVRLPAQARPPLRPEFAEISGRISHSAARRPTRERGPRAITAADGHRRATPSEPVAATGPRRRPQAACARRAIARRSWSRRRSSASGTSSRYVVMNKQRRGFALPPPHTVDRTGVPDMAATGNDLFEGMLDTGRVALIGLADRDRASACRSRSA